MAAQYEQAIFVAVVMPGERGSDAVIENYGDRQLVKLIARRLHSSVEIARIKAVEGISLRSPDREAELIEEARDDARSLGIDPEYAADLMDLVLRYSREAQHRALDKAPGQSADTSR